MIEGRARFFGCVDDGASAELLLGDGFARSGNNGLIAEGSANGFASPDPSCAGFGLVLRKAPTILFTRSSRGLERRVFQTSGATGGFGLGSVLDIASFHSRTASS